MFAYLLAFISRFRPQITINTRPRATEPPARTARWLHLLSFHLGIVLLVILFYQLLRSGLVRR